ncbi:hypothetical protein BDZ89DRAFT_1044057 [Hymenopellis radicata]|nr:hypothetical protein BDZ89DRAFT_1044057 [Hymenopellis radicata]
MASNGQDNVLRTIPAPQRPLLAARPKTLSLPSAVLPSRELAAAADKGKAPVNANPTKATSPKNLPSSKKKFARQIPLPSEEDICKLAKRFADAIPETSSVIQEREMREMREKLKKKKEEKEKKEREDKERKEKEEKQKKEKEEKDAKDAKEKLERKEARAAAKAKKKAAKVAVSPPRKPHQRPPRLTDARHSFHPLASPES